MMHMKRYRPLAFVALVIAALAVSSVALASAGLTGRYTATIESPAQLKGKWVLTLARDGSYTVQVNGQPVARGKYTSTAQTITFARERGSGCTGAGTYVWKKSRTTLSFTRKRESASCRARAAVLAHRFTLLR